MSVKSSARTVYFLVLIILLKTSIFPQVLFALKVMLSLCFGRVEAFFSKFGIVIYEF
jgi:hypothetical protein